MLWMIGRGMTGGYLCKESSGEEVGQDIDGSDLVQTFVLTAEYA